MNEQTGVEGERRDGDGDGDRRAVSKIDLG